MIRLRPFKISDAEYLINWVGEERQFTMWSAGKFEYPLTKEQLIKYKEIYENDEHGWIFTALDEIGKPVGHFIMRMVDYQKQSVHLGFIIVNPEIRGKGYGKEMVSLGVKYAFEILKVKRVTLKVFENNPAAHSCYKSIGLSDEKYHEGLFTYKDEKWGLYDMAIENKI
jgi:RimJ/RimL family protein N-acetyltransferase